MLQQRDANDLANWLGVKLVVQRAREKHLQYECWTEGRMRVATSERPDRIDDAPLPAGVQLDTISAPPSLALAPRSFAAFFK